MSAHLRSRPGRTWRYALPAVLVTAAVTATLVPGQAAAATAAEDQDFAPVTAVDPTRTDPEVLAVTAAAADALEYSTAVVAADPTRAYPDGTVEATLRAGLLTLPPEALREATRSAQALVTADVGTRVAEFGQYGRNDWATHARLGFAGVFRAESLPVDRAALTARLSAQADQLAVEGREAEGKVAEEARRLGVDPAGIKRVKALALDISSVKCVHETWDGSADDEISMGGVTVGSDGVTTKIGPFKVHDNMDTGDIVVYDNGGRRFSTLDMTQPGVWPRVYGHSVFLAERDPFGGFSDALTKAWAQVREYVQAAIAVLVGGLLSPYLGPAIAAALGKAVAWLVNVFIGWLLKIIKDDVFAPQHVNVKLPSNAAFFYENPVHLGWTDYRSPTMSAWYKGHGGGNYRVNAHLEVIP